MSGIVFDISMRVAVPEAAGSPGTEPANSPPNESFDSHLNRNEAPAPAPERRKHEEDRDDSPRDSTQDSSTVPPPTNASQPESKPADDGAQDESEEAAATESVEEGDGSEKAHDKARANRARKLHNADVPLAAEASAAKSQKGEEVAREVQASDSQAANELTAEQSQETAVLNEVELISEAEAKTSESGEERTTSKKEAGTESATNTEHDSESQTDQSIEVNLERPESQVQVAETAAEPKPLIESKSGRKRDSGTNPAAAEVASSPNAVQAPTVTATDEANESKETRRKGRTGVRQLEALLPEGAGNANAPEGTPAARLAQHLVARNSDRPAKGSHGHEVDQARFVDRVARAFQAAENREGSIKLRLHPPELGSVRIELRVHNGALNARLEAETPMAQSLLLDHAQSLRERLAEQGVKIERFDVDLTDRRSPGDTGGFDQGRSREGNSHDRNREDVPTPLREPEVARTPRTQPKPGQLNVIV